MTFVTPIMSCRLCGASWAMPKEEPHECVVERYRKALERIDQIAAISDPIHCEYELVKQLQAIARDALAPPSSQDLPRAGTQDAGPQGGSGGDSNRPARPPARGSSSSTERPEG